MLLLWRHGVQWDCGVIADVDNGWGECIVPIGSEIYAWNVRSDSRRILSDFLNYFTFHVVKGIKNGCLCTVEIRGTYGCALATSMHSPTARAGSPTKAKPCVPLISTMHGQTFLIPLTRYSHRVPGYLTRYSVSGNEISFDKKIADQIVSFNWCSACLTIIISPHLVTSTGFLKAKLEFYSKYGIVIWFIFWMALIWPLKCKLYHCLLI